MPPTDAPPARSRRRCIQALWQRNWGAALFLIGPAMGLGLVNLIFTFPPGLWFAAFGMAFLMLALLGHLLWQDIKRQCQQSAQPQPLND